MNTRMHQIGAALDYTNPSGSTTIKAGELVKVAGLVGAAINDIAPNALGAVQVAGVAAIPKKNEAIQAGLPVWWDADGNPVSGTAGTGAATSYGNSAMAAGDLLCGCAVYAAASGDATVAVALNKFSPDYPAWANRYHKAATTATLSTNELGCVLRVSTADQVLTLNEIATVYIGNEVIIINDCADGAGTTGLRITPHTNDGFSGYGITHATNKYLTNTAGTAKRGDYIRLLSAGDTHWAVLERRGIWARQA